MLVAIGHESNIFEKKAHLVREKDFNYMVYSLIKTTFFNIIHYEYIYMYSVF